MLDKRTISKTLTVAHLYPDVMDLYGDTGNLVALRRRCEWRGIRVEVVRVRVGDRDLPADTDLVLIGGGQDTAQALISPDLARHAERMRGLVEAGAPLLAVCGGFQLLGASYETVDGETLPGIDVFDAVTVSGPGRVIGNVVVRTFAQGPDTTVVPAGTALVGFENHAGLTRLGPNARPLGAMLHGAGNTGDGEYEGAVYRNAVGTYLHGPVLPKNPLLADGLISAALAHRYGGPQALASLDDRAERVAHRVAADAARVRAASSQRQRLAS
jgi:lipid II isoglutaminyl synthase (glutamine-hydrolysing)